MMCAPHNGRSTALSVLPRVAATWATGVSIVHTRGELAMDQHFDETLMSRIDFSQATTSAVAPKKETFTIERPSFALPDARSSVNNDAEKGPHTIFNMRDPSTGAEHRESLRIRAWRDKSVLEVLVNEQSAISTRLYAAEDTAGIRFFADDDHSRVDKASCSGPSESQAEIPV